MHYIRSISVNTVNCKIHEPSILFHSFSSMFGLYLVWPWWNVRFNWWAIKELETQLKKKLLGSGEMKFKTQWRVSIDWRTKIKKKKRKGAGEWYTNVNMWVKSLQFDGAYSGLQSLKVFVLDTVGFVSSRQSSQDRAWLKRSLDMAPVIIYSSLYFLVFFSLQWPFFGTSFVGTMSVTLFSIRYECY
jgi:hypothetical protein